MAISSLRPAAGPFAMLRRQESPLPLARQGPLAASAAAACLAADSARPKPRGPAASRANTAADPSLALLPWTSDFLGDCLQDRLDGGSNHEIDHFIDGSLSLRYQIEQRQLKLSVLGQELRQLPAPKLERRIDNRIVFLHDGGSVNVEKAARSYPRRGNGAAISFIQLSTEIGTSSVANASVR
jgi:hypothetical protein